MSASAVKHQGVVSKMTDDCIEVSIISMSACSSCHAKSACTISDSKEKSVKVYDKSASEKYSVGESVNVIMKKTKGLEAVLWGYLLPFFVLLVTLVVALNYTNELRAGLISLGSLVPYYLLLYAFRGKIRQSFSFEIEKL